MRPRDYDPDEADPQAYLDALEDWENEQERLIAAQQAASDALVAAQAAQSELDGLVAALDQLRAIVAGHRDALSANGFDLGALDPEVAEADGLVADYTAAREVATARLIGGPAASVPLVLLPVRLQTRWLDGALNVRVYPGELGVDGHDPTLTADEKTWAQHYWAVRSGDVDADQEETWQQLVRRFGPTRAAWLVGATRPGAPDVVDRPQPWPQPAQARLLPDRFAVVAFSAGLPVDVGPAGGPPRYVTWSAPVAEPLTLSPADESSWWSDLEAAHGAGMAVAIRPPDGHPPIDTLVAVGLRGARPEETAEAGLAGLLAAHAVTSGVQLLPDGTATNNSAHVRSAHSPQAQERAARAVRDAAVTPPPVPADGSAGQQLATILGLDAEVVAGFDGSGTDWRTLTEAARLVVGAGTQGALRRALAAEAGSADAPWTLLTAGGPAPVLRVGRQPYGVLPASAPGRWTGQAGETGGVLATALHQWGAAVGPALATDPGDPPSPVSGVSQPRAVTPEDDRDLPSVLLESASSLTWSVAGGGPGESDPTADAATGLVGPAEGASSIAVALPAIVAAAPDELPSLPAQTRTGSLVARIAVAAKSSAAAAADPVAARNAVEQVDAALSVLAAAVRAPVARTVGELLDATSHRFDAWVSAVVTERLAAQRKAAPPEVVVGAFGVLTGVSPRVLPRSYGHVHAPSLGHAATAAVLRSGFLGERSRAWAQRVDEAAAECDAIRAELSDDSLSPQERAQLVGELRVAQRRLADTQAAAATLPPLEPAAEQRLPMAVDLSSRRVRGALQVLSAVRAGQPLGAVLGYAFERDLADAGLLAYLAAFRKLTRFRTGTALDDLEQQRQDRRDDLATARRHLAELQQKAAQLAAPLEQARAVEAAAAQRVALAEAAYAPFQRIETVDLPAAQQRVAELTAELAAVDAAKPTPARHPFHVNLP